MKFHHPNKRKHSWLFYKLMEQKLKDINNQLKGVIYDLGCGELSYTEYISNPTVSSYIGVD
jgi:hypothetical protein